MCTQGLTKQRFLVVFVPIFGVLCGYLFCFFEFLWLWCDRRKNKEIFDDDEAKRSMTKSQQGKDSFTVVQMNEIKLEFDDNSSNNSSYK